MTVYTNSAYETPFSNLPSELASVMFDLATVHCRPNADKCRLVCRDFHMLSSPFPISTIVIAERYDALRKAREVLLHPYFSKHVTNLLCNASHYEKRLATNYDAYRDAFINYCHTFDREDESYTQKRAADALLQRQLRCEEPTALSIPLQSRGSRSLLEDGLMVSAQDERGRLVGQYDNGDEPKSVDENSCVSMRG